MDNLAWCCRSCNLHKGDRIEAIDPLSGSTVPLFHPRQQDWNANFRWTGYQLDGNSAVGRATVRALDLIHPPRILVRKAEKLFGLFPP
jgi:hypothetical protein